jgi:hypothetical protein
VDFITTMSGLRFSAHTGTPSQHDADQLTCH